MGQETTEKVCIPKCCFCLELKTGVLVLGILSSILIGIAMIAYIAQGAIIGLALGFVASVANAKTPPFAWAILAVWIIGALIYFAYFICSILLAVGASKEKTGLLIPWMVMCIISIIFALIVIIFRFASPPEDTKTHVTYIPWGEIISNAVGIVLQVYFFIVVYSFINKLKGNEPTSQIA